MRIPCIAALLCLAGAAAPASAGVVHFKATIVQSPFGDPMSPWLADSLAFGDTFSGRFSYDSSATRVDFPGLGSGVWAQYQLPVSEAFSLTFQTGASAGYSVSGRYPAFVANDRVVVADNYSQQEGVPGNDLFAANVRLPYNEFRPGTYWSDFSMSVTDPTQTAVQSGDLSNWNADLHYALASEARGYLQFLRNGEGATLRFNITEFTHANPGQSVASTVAIGSGSTTASLLGGTAAADPGGIDVSFSAPTGGSAHMQVVHSTPSYDDFSEDFVDSGSFALLNFPGSEAGLQLWELGYSETLAPGQLVTLSFKYDDSNLLLPEESLGILHFGKYGENGEREWKWLTGDVDSVNNVITITVDHFSPFVLGYQVPEPSTYALAACGILGLAVFRRHRASTM